MVRACNVKWGARVTMVCTTYGPHSSCFFCRCLHHACTRNFWSDTERSTLDFIYMLTKGRPIFDAHGHASRRTMWHHHNCGARRMHVLSFSVVLVLGSRVLPVLNTYPRAHLGPTLPSTYRTCLPAHTGPPPCRYRTSPRTRFVLSSCPYSTYPSRSIRSSISPR